MWVISSQRLHTQWHRISGDRDRQATCCSPNWQSEVPRVSLTGPTQEATILTLGHEQLFSHGSIDVCMEPSIHTQVHQIFTSTWYFWNSLPFAKANHFNPAPLPSGSHKLTVTPGCHGRLGKSDNTGSYNTVTRNSSVPLLCLTLTN